MSFAFPSGRAVCTFFVAPLSQLQSRCGPFRNHSTHANYFSGTRTGVHVHWTYYEV